MSDATVSAAMATGVPTAKPNAHPARIAHENVGKNDTPTVATVNKKKSTNPSVPCSRSHGPNQFSVVSSTKPPSGGQNESTMATGPDAPSRRNTLPAGGWVGVAPVSWDDTPSF